MNFNLLTAPVCVNEIRGLPVPPFGRRYRNLLASFTVPFRTAFGGWRWLLAISYWLLAVGPALSPGTGSEPSSPGPFSRAGGRRVTTSPAAWVTGAGLRMTGGTRVHRVPRNVVAKGDAERSLTVAVLMVGRAGVVSHFVVRRETGSRGPLRPRRPGLPPHQGNHSFALRPQPVPRP